MISISSRVRVLSSLQHSRHVFKALPARPHICAFRACKCTVSILQRDVRKPAAASATAAIWRPTVGHARGESYVLVLLYPPHCHAYTKPSQSPARTICAPIPSFASDGPLTARAQTCKMSSVSYRTRRKLGAARDSASVGGPTVRR